MKLFNNAARRKLVPDGTWLPWPRRPAAPVGFLRERPLGSERRSYCAVESAMEATVAAHPSCAFIERAIDGTAHPPQCQEISCCSAAIVFAGASNYDRWSGLIAATFRGSRAMRTYSYL